MTPLGSTTDLIGSPTFPMRLSRLYSRKSEKNPPKTWEEAWKRSIDWEIEHGVRSVNG